MSTSSSPSDSTVSGNQSESTANEADAPESDPGPSATESTTSTEATEPSAPESANRQENAPSDSESGVERFELSVNQQMKFGSGGGLEPAERSTETTLGQFDVDIDTRDKETRLDRPKASGLMCDDRPEVAREGSGEQQALFSQVDKGQKTLTGETASPSCLFDDAGDGDDSDDSDDSDD